MRVVPFFAVMIAASGCSAIERSRSLDDPIVPAATIAQQICSQCHGLKGRSVSPAFPNLAGQQRHYIVEELHDFKEHDRCDPMAIDYMWGMARDLSDAQIADLAEYFSRQSPAAAVSAGDDGAAERGKDVFTRGVPEKDVPSCATCHGARAEGTEEFPRLANQHADYLVKQLLVFRESDQRPDGSIARTKAHDLSAQDMEAVAAYLASLSL